jgi:peptidoglycan/LPS O-acetylase OafA/YrhL
MNHARVNEVDLLRFIAALLVVFFHYAFRGYAADGLSSMPYPWLAPAAKYGYLGANLFFLISGFVILMTAERGSLRGFVVSRMVRLYPAFWACCTLTFLAILLAGAPRFHAAPGQYLANMTMLGGFMGTDWIDGAYWTLFVEVKFYVLVCAVLVLGRMRHVQALLAGWLLLSVLGEAWPNKYLRYFLITDYAAYFIGGAVCFLVWSRGLSGVRIALLLLCWCLALFQSTLAIAGMAAHYRTGFSNWVAGGLVTACFGTMLLVALRATGRFGRTRWLAAGALTYPLYLLHQNIGFIVFNKAYPAVNAHLLLWGTLALMLAAAWMVHTQVERRFSPAFKRMLERGPGWRPRRPQARTAARDSGSPTPP